MNSETVLDRLDRLKRIAARHGFEVRAEPLGQAGGGANGGTWCEIRGRRVLFLDLSQTAAEQIAAIREVLEITASVRPHQPSRPANPAFAAQKAA